MSFITRALSNYEILPQDVKKEIGSFLSFPDAYNMGMTSTENFQLAQEVIQEGNLINPELRFFHHQGLSLFPQLTTSEGRDITRDVTVRSSESAIDRTITLIYREIILGEVVFQIELTTPHNLPCYNTLISIYKINNRTSSETDLVGRVKGVSNTLMMLIMQIMKKEQHIL